MTNNNPWGGNGGNGGNNGGRPPSGGGGGTPPDFDKIIEDLKNKIGGMLGGGSGNNRNSGGGGTSQGTGVLIPVVLTAIAIGWMATGFYRVKSGEQGVVMRFGGYVSTTLAGLNYHLPYPIETVNVVDIASNRNIAIGYTPAQMNYYSGYRSEPIDERQMLTGDENIVNIEFDVRWKVSGASEFLFNIKNPEATIQAVSESMMREVVGRNKIDDILTDGRDLIENQVKDNIQKTLNRYNSGVEILQVAIKEASPPEPVVADFQDVQAALLDKERFVQEATAIANKILPQSRAQVTQIEQEAEAYKQQIIAAANGDTSRFNKIYDEYKKAPDVTKKRLYLETMEVVYADKKKLFISGNKGGDVLPYLPVQDVLKTTKSQGQGGQ